MTYLESDMHAIARHVVSILYEYIYDMEGTGMDTQQLEFRSYHIAWTPHRHFGTNSIQSGS
jgi:hypothetical protein